MVSGSLGMYQIRKLFIYIFSLQLVRTSITMSIGVRDGLMKENVIPTPHGCTITAIRAVPDVSQTVSGLNL